MYWKFVDSNTRIMGSMHLIPAENRGLPTWALDAFAWADSIVLESDGSKLASLAVATEPSRLSIDIPRDAWAAIEALWAKWPGAPSPDGFKPWWVFLLSTLFAQRTQSGIEQFFTQRSIEQSRTPQYLETSEDIAAIFDGVEYADICKGLETLALDLSAPQRAVEETYSAWFRGDLAGVGAVALKSPLFALPHVKAAVIDRRNQNWIPHLQRVLESPARTLVAVGALHLHGSGSVLELLDRRVELLI
jgi:uncharacterized protein YbaP (TraB family)